MKKVLMSFVFVAMLSGNAFALPFSSLGWVDPSYGDDLDGDPRTGTALFSFYLLQDNVDVTAVELQFEADIFDTFDAGSVSVVNPTDWTDITFDDVNGTWTIASAGNGTLVNSTNDPLQILVDYTLLSEDMFDQGSGLDWAWNEAQGNGEAWSMQYQLNGVFNSNAEFAGTGATSGGSTAAVPEPGTLFLLGSGLVGMAYYGRRRKE